MTISLMTDRYLQKSKAVIKPYLENTSAMVILHNIVLQGLNSIYLHAPHITPKDYSNFINYCYWYLDSLRILPHRFFTEKLRSIIDDFDPISCMHLEDKMPILLALDRYGERLPIVAMGKAEGRRSSAEMEETRVLMFFSMIHNRAFEGGT